MEVSRVCSNPLVAVTSPAIEPWAVKIAAWAADSAMKKADETRSGAANMGTGEQTHY
jgi:hypothetical protein